MKCKKSQIELSYPKQTNGVESHCLRQCTPRTATHTQSVFEERNTHLCVFTFINKNVSKVRNDGSV